MREFNLFRFKFKLLARDAAFMFMLSMMLIFPNSFSIYKMIFVLFIIGVLVFNLIKKKIKIKSIHVLVFYFLFSLFSLIWLFIGLVNDGMNEAIYDYFKIYVLYSVIYSILMVSIQDGRYMSVIVKSILFSGLIIVIINAVLLCEVFFNFELLPFWFRDEIVGSANITEDHISVSANNINSLFFIAPVVYVCATSNTMNISRSKSFSWILLLMMMTISVLSGRRALLLLLFFIPIFYTLQSFLFFNKADRKYVSLSFFEVMLLFIFPIFVVFIANSLDLINIQVFLARFGENFDTGNARTDQFGALIDGFFNNFWIGSGFGKSVEIIRDSDRPWLYELTYLQLLFNGGLIGFLAVSILVISFYIIALRRISNFNSCKTEALALLTGFVVFSFASATNPYYSGFDTLFIIGILPLLAGWHAYSDN